MRRSFVGRLSKGRTAGKMSMRSKPPSSSTCPRFVKQAPVEARWREVVHVRRRVRAEGEESVGPRTVRTLSGQVFDANGSRPCRARKARDNQDSTCHVGRHALRRPGRSRSAMLSRVQLPNKPRLYGPWNGGLARGGEHRAKREWGEHRAKRKWGRHCAKRKWGRHCAKREQRPSECHAGERRLDGSECCRIHRRRICRKCCPDRHVRVRFLRRIAGFERAVGRWGGRGLRQRGWVRALGRRGSVLPCGRARYELLRDRVLPANGDHFVRRGHRPGRLDRLIDMDVLVRGRGRDL
jgi:hypothetical protein